MVLLPSQHRKAIFQSGLECSVRFHNAIAIEVDPHSSIAPLALGAKQSATLGAFTFVACDNDPAVATSPLV
ncbi:MAG: hypothetical protein KGQ51_18020 [Planctomycetes bacterium]|nr:hypothetical protein [Planctomycetota bacterium]